MPPPPGRLSRLLPAAGLSLLSPRLPPAASPPNGHLGPWPGLSALPVPLDACGALLGVGEGRASSGPSTQRRPSSAPRRWRLRGQRPPWQGGSSPPRGGRQGCSRVAPSPGGPQPGEGPCAGGPPHGLGQAPATPNCLSCFTCCRPLPVLATLSPCPLCQGCARSLPSQVNSSPPRARLGRSTPRPPSWARIDGRSPARQCASQGPSHRAVYGRVPVPGSPALPSSLPCTVPQQPEGTSLNPARPGPTWLRTASPCPLGPTAAPHSHRPPAALSPSLPTSGPLSSPGLGLGPALQALCRPRLLEQPALSRLSHSQGKQSGHLPGLPGDWPSSRPRPGSLQSCLCLLPHSGTVPESPCRRLCAPCLP